MKIGIQVVAAALVVSLCVADSAFARGRLGSSGSMGSGGSSGASGGSSGASGSHGSTGSGGSSGSRGWRGSRGSGGSHGSGGSSGGSYGSYGSGGSEGGSSGSYGSGRGEAYGSAYVYGADAPYQPAVSLATPGKARLVFHVPADAKVFLMGQKMASTGGVRVFSSPVLKTGQKFGYPIRVELTRNGQTFKAEGTQVVRAGDRVELNVEFVSKLGQLSLVQSAGQSKVLELVRKSEKSDLMVQQ